MKIVRLSHSSFADLHKQLEIQVSTCSETVCLAKTLRVRRINDLGAHLCGMLFAMIA